MQGFRPTRSTLHNLIRYSLRVKDWNIIWLLCDDFGKFNAYPDASSCCSLISSCIRAKRFKLADNLLPVLKFEKEVAVLSFNAAIRSYNKLHMYSSAVKVFDIMVSSHMQLDGECYGRTMEAYLKMGMNEKVVSLFKEFESSKVEWTPFCSQIYRILCESLAKTGKSFQALDYFREMINKGFQEDPSFYVILISSFVSVRDVKMVESLLEEAEGKKMLRDPAVFLKVVLMYVELGLLENTLDVVSSMKRVNIKVSDCIFCAIVNGYSKKRWLGVYDKAEEVFREMDNKGFDKCVVAYSSMIAMYGKVNRIRDAMRLLARMKERGVELNGWIYNSLLDMHGKVLNLKQVEKIAKVMKRRKVVLDFIGLWWDLCGVFSKICRWMKLWLLQVEDEGTGLDARLYRSSLNALRDAGVYIQVKWLEESFDPSL
ncbi:pentatricopeptide repeat-containing protein [Tanacetum coccineum]|uniref:Pentatricopeptide repeat-containing protein n=1 Tax=Tanacetum coccineum TaxID=301880 RepID=A0ABQ4ZQ56_9ASTR